MPSAPTMSGADPAELERAAAELRRAAAELDGHAGSLTADLRSTMWTGGVATWFVGHWHSQHRPRLGATAAELREAAGRLAADAADQRRASAVATGGSSGGWGTPTAGLDVDALERVDDVIGRLGLARAELDAAAGAARRLADGAVADRVVALLADDRFASFLEASRDVVDIGLFVTDFLVDVAEHTDLGWDEQLVHGLADAGARFSLKEGAEKGAEFLAGALTTALVPALGAVMAPLVSELAGAVAASLMGELVDAVDGSTDVIDLVADHALDAYRQIKATIGVILDVAAAGAAVVTGAVDLAGDAAEWLVDGAGDLVGDLGAAVGDVGDAVGDVGGWLGGQLGL